MTRPDIDALTLQLSLDEIQQLLETKKRQSSRVEQLTVERKELAQRIADIEQEIASLGGGATDRAPAAAEAQPVAPRKPGRPKKASSKVSTEKASPKKTRRKRAGKSVRDHVLEFLASKGGEASLVEVVDAVCAARGKTPNASDKSTIGNILATEANVERVGRGVYRLK